MGEPQGRAPHRRSRRCHNRLQLRSGDISYEPSRHAPASMPLRFEFVPSLHSCMRLDRISIAIRGQVWQLMAITNHTDHILRFNYVAIRLFDPAGTQNEPLAKDDVAARLYNARPCSSSQQAVARVSHIKIFDRNMEVVPGTTASFWVPFAPPSVEMPGVWKYAIYDVPVKTDPAGRTVRATRFEVRTVATKLVDTFRRDSPWTPPVLVRTEEDRGYAIPPPSEPSVQPSRPKASDPPTVQRPTPTPSPPSMSAPSPQPPPTPTPPARSSQESSPPERATAPVRFVSVEKANLRDGPDPKARVLRVLTKGTKLTVITKSNQWYRVRLDNGVEGWVAESVTSARSE